MSNPTDTLRPALARSLSTERSGVLVDRVLQAVVSLYQLVAVGAFVAALVLANSWLKTPFMGAFFEQTLVFNGSAPSGESSTWDLYSQGVKLGDRLTSVNGVQVSTSAEVEKILGGFFPGETIPVGINSGGVEKTLQVKLNSIPTDDVTSYFTLPVIISFLFLAISIAIFGMRRQEKAGRSFAILSASLSLATGCFFDLYTTHNLTPLWTLGLALTGGALVDLALSFPQEARAVIGRPYLRWLGYLVAIGLSVYAFTTLYNLTRPLDYLLAWRLIYVFVGLVQPRLSAGECLLRFYGSIAGGQDSGAHDPHRNIGGLRADNDLAADHAPAPVRFQHLSFPAHRALSRSRSVIRFCGSVYCAPTIGCARVSFIFCSASLSWADTPCLSRA